MYVIFRRAHKVWLKYVGKKKEEEAQFMPEARSVEVCFGAQKQKSTRLESLFSPLFSTAFVRSFAPQNWFVFFPFFACSNSKFLLFKTQNPPKARLG
jgi:hypothetical protein